jgi:hypothetical protein
MKYRITAIILWVYPFAGCAGLTRVLQTASKVQELKIRKEVSVRVTPILQKVFGSLDNK